MQNLSFVALVIRFSLFQSDNVKKRISFHKVAENLTFFHSTENIQAYFCDASAVCTAWTRGNQTSHLHIWIMKRRAHVKWCKEIPLINCYLRFHMFQISSHLQRTAATNPCVKYLVRGSCLFLFECFNCTHISLAFVFLCRAKSHAKSALNFNGWIENGGKKRERTEPQFGSCSSKEKNEHAG